MNNEKLSFLEKVLGSYRKSGKEILFYCPFCTHHKPKLSINPETDRWQCFPCGKAGRNLFSLIKKIGSREDLEEYNKNYRAEDVRELREVDTSFKMTLPKAYMPLVNVSESFAAQRALSYLKKRNISNNEILRFKLGISLDGDFSDAIIIPSFDVSGNVNFFTSRSVNKNSYVKYKNPTVPQGYKNTVIFNELNIDWDEPVVLVEGFFDLFKSCDNTIPLLGSTLIEDSKLFRTIVEKNAVIYLALDQDARNKSLKIANSLLKYGIQVFYIDVSPYSDLGSFPDKKIFYEKYREALRFNKISLLHERIKSL